jgi:hypothetical protein
LLGLRESHKPDLLEFGQIDPETFEARAKLSRELGAKLVRHAGKRIFLDELPETAKGRRLKSMPDCGVLCDTSSKSNT